MSKKRSQNWQFRYCVENLTPAIDMAAKNRILIDAMYSQLAVIESNLLSQIKLVFISNKFGSSDVVFITNSDDIYAFGSNLNGKLGFGHLSAVVKPTLIPELCAKNIKSFEFGMKVMIALTQSGEVLATNSDGMVAYNSGVHTNSKPKKISANMGEIVVDIKCCAASTYLLTKSGKIYWFGVRYNAVVNTPAFIDTHQNVISISSGYEHTLMLTDTRNVYSLNMNRDDYYYYDRNASQPIQLPENNTSIKQISCGNYHSLLLTNNGKVYAFGKNECGQLGHANNVQQSNQPKLVVCKESFIEIFAFEDTSMALTSQMNVLVWGKTRHKNIKTPFNTNMRSFQEAINSYSESSFTYKPLSCKEICSEKPSVNRVIKTMAKAFNNPKNSDLKFKVKHKDSENCDYIYGHKWFIEENSEYFERMFANNWSENSSNEIQISGYSYEAYYHFIRYLYTDIIENKDINELSELLAISDEYLDEEMKGKCVQCIRPLIRLQNVCSLYSSALKYRSAELEEYCFEIMSKSISSVTRTEDYERMDSNYAKHFLTMYSQLK